MIVVWRVTERCNLSCKFCAYDREIDRIRRDASPEQILSFSKVLADYQNATGDGVLVSWLGGEPLLWPQLTELSVTLSKQLKLRISTTTNGTLLSNEKIRRHLLECYSELTASVDGLSQFHDVSRGWKGGFELLGKSVRALAAEKHRNKFGPIIRVNVLLMRDNIRMFPEICAELCDWGVEEITFNQLGGVDRPEFFPAHRLLPEDVMWLAHKVPELTKELAKRNVKLRSHDVYLARLKATAENFRVPVTDCHPGEKFLFVDEAGRIAPCNFTAAEYGISVNEFRSVETLKQLPARFAEMRSRRRSSFCDDCHSTQVFEKFAA